MAYGSCHCESEEVVNFKMNVKIEGGRYHFQRKLWMKSVKLNLNRYENGNCLIFLVKTGLCVTASSFTVKNDFVKCILLLFVLL